MHRSNTEKCNTEKWQAKNFAWASILALSVLGFGVTAKAADPDSAVDAIPTATPIKHIVIIVGENRSFDHLFATYVPKSKNQKVFNLLSQGIVNGDGLPGPNFAKGHQYEIVSAPNAGKFFSSADMAHKALYATLPPPDLSGTASVSPYAPLLALGGDPGLPPVAQFLLALGVAACPSRSARISVSPT